MSSTESTTTLEPFTASRRELLAGASSDEVVLRAHQVVSEAALHVAFLRARSSGFRRIDIWTDAEALCAHDTCLDPDQPAGGTLVRVELAELHVAGLVHGLLGELDPTAPDASIELEARQLREPSSLPAEVSAVFMVHREDPEGPIIVIAVREGRCCLGRFEQVSGNLLLEPVTVHEMWAEVRSLTRL